MIYIPGWNVRIRDSVIVVRVLANALKDTMAWHVSAMCVRRIVIIVAHVSLNECWPTRLGASIRHPGML
jgi:hypothetical protein